MLWLQEVVVCPLLGQISLLSKAISSFNNIAYFVFILTSWLTRRTFWLVSATFGYNLIMLVKLHTSTFTRWQVIVFPCQLTSTPLPVSQITACRERDLMSQIRQQILISLLNKIKQIANTYMLQSMNADAVTHLFNPISVLLV